MAITVRNRTNNYATERLLGALTIVCYNVQWVRRIQIVRRRGQLHLGQFIFPASWQAKACRRLLPTHPVACSVVGLAVGVSFFLAVRGKGLM